MFADYLHSFLDDGKNTELIRWSDRGDSFVVLDEDEFAKTLIPELFKHNNYASFVRQLNMYGFHKRVGLSDNSMKASERKNKSPSEYYNPYFKRGHPNLLWLINKPKGGGGKKKDRRVKSEAQLDIESDDEKDIEEVYGNDVQASRALSAVPEVGPLQGRQVAVLQNQLAEIQKQQGNITNAIQRLRKDHNQLYQQSMAFQTLHDRHENSINAILTFLATVYNRSLDGQGVPQNIAQMFQNGIPNSDQRHGSVVDVGDASNQQQQPPGSVSPHRRPHQQRLLMAPPTSNGGRVSSGTPSATNTPKMPNQTYRRTPQPGAVEELFDTSPQDSSSPQTNPAGPNTSAEPDKMMSLINNTNAQNLHPSNSTMDFPEMLTHYEHANGNSPLTNEQRNHMLEMMASSASASGTNNALVSPTPPPVDWTAMQYTAEEVENLMKLQHQTGDQINQVKSSLEQNSPTSRVSGLDDTTNSYFNNSGDISDPGGNSNLDLDQFLDPGAFLNGSSPLAGDYGHYDSYADGMGFDNGGESHFDVGMDGTGYGDEGRIVETSESTPEDIKPDPEMMNNGMRSPVKKRRKN